MFYLSPSFSARGFSCYNQIMKIALLGYGKEGQSTEKYFKKHHQNIVCDVFENFTYEEIKQKDFSSYDYVFRSPSVPPLHLANETSVTKYFFDHCPCPIIGVTATKGKGTTCSFIKSILDAMKEDAYLVGNIGTPSIDILDQLKPSSVVVYELSSFQLWDLAKSPHVAVIGHLEPDHLNVHRSYKEYLTAKTNICKYQSSDDYCVYFQENSHAKEIAQTTPAHSIPFPCKVPGSILKSIALPGAHNQNNAIAAIAAVASYKDLTPEDFIKNNKDAIKQGLQDFKGLPHRLEFVRELNHIKYYDDSFSTNPASTRVAIEAFPHDKIIMIAGGRDKTNNEDLAEIYQILTLPQVKKVILIGESGHEIAHRYPHHSFREANSLSAAVTAAKLEAENLSKHHTTSTIVLLSPAAASFDMFKNVYDRGEQYQKLINALS